MKAGDLVRLMGSYAPFSIGVAVSKGEGLRGWWNVYLDGVMVQWPATQLESASHEPEGPPITEVS
jgi:hypothetical protein